MPPRMVFNKQNAWRYRKPETVNFEMLSTNRICESHSALLLENTGKASCPPGARGGGTEGRCWATPPPEDNARGQHWRQAQPCYCHRAAGLPSCRGG